MFTGIIQESGIVEKMNDPTRVLSQDSKVKMVTLKAPFLVPQLKAGSSVAVDGVCLTVVAQSKDTFTVEAIPETLEKTIIGHYKIGQQVNLELPLKVGDRLDGHMVSGHIDYKGKILERVQFSDSKTQNTFVLRITFEPHMAKYFAMKGSVTVNGVSLTISRLHEESFEVSIIPHTQTVTNLSLLKAGDEVNLEVDLIARYLESLLKHKDQEITYQFLQERGFV